MTTACSIVPASIRHVKPMGSKLRAAACITLQGFGMEPRRALHRAFLASHYCRTALVDGKPVAMWGVKGTMLGDSAIVWLVLSNDVTRMPITIVRTAKAELAKVMESNNEVAITVLPDDEAAVRFAVHLGFHDREDEGLTKRELCEQIITDPKYRIPIGDSFVIAMGYHPETRH